MEAASDYAREAAEVDAAVNPVLTLPSGKQISVGHLKARTVIRYLKDMHTVADESVSPVERLSVFADLLDRFADELGEPEVRDLDIEDFMRLFSDFFSILVQKMRPRTLVPH